MVWNLWGQTDMLRYFFVHILVAFNTFNHFNKMPSLFIEFNRITHNSAVCIQSPQETISAILKKITKLNELNLILSQVDNFVIWI